MIHNTNLCNRGKLSTINIYALAFFASRCKIRKATVLQKWHHKRCCYSIYKFSHNIHSKYQSVKFVAGVRVAERTALQFFLLFLAGIGGIHAIRTTIPPNPFGFFGAFGLITLEMPKILSTGSYLYCVCMMLSPLAVSSMPCNRTYFPCRCPCACIWCARPCRSPPRHDRLFLALLVRLDACMHGLQVSTHLRNFSSVELFLPNIITIYISNPIYFKLIAIN